MAANNAKSQKLLLRELCQKQNDDTVRRAMRLVMAMIAGRKPEVSSHFFCGASAIHPRYLAVWYLFATDAEWKMAEKTGLASDIETITREALVAASYPATGAAQMSVNFTSEEDIRRKSGGDRKAYFLEKGVSAPTAVDRRVRPAH